jgi:hypothetical protein
MDRKIAHEGRPYGRLRRHVEVALGPGRDHVGHIGGIAAAAEQVIGAGERDEALGMPGGREDAARIVDADDVVGGRMEDQQRLVQGVDAPAQFLLGDVVQKGAADAERAAREPHLDLAAGFDLHASVPEQPRHMGRVGGRGDRHHRAGFRHRGRGRQDRGAAEAVADEERRRALEPAQVVGGRHQVGDIG